MESAGVNSRDELERVRKKIDRLDDQIDELNGRLQGLPGQDEGSTRGEVASLRQALWKEKGQLREQETLFLQALLGKPAAAAAASRPPHAAKEAVTLFERGIAGKEEPAHIRNAVDMSELYPGGILPRGRKDEFTLSSMLRVLLAFSIIFAMGLALTYCLEKLPRWIAHFSSSSNSTASVPGVHSEL